MHDPCFHTYISHGGEKGLDEGGQVVQSFVWSDLLACKASIVVWMKADSGKFTISHEGETALGEDKRRFICDEPLSVGA